MSARPRAAVHGFAEKRQVILNLRACLTHVASGLQFSLRTNYGSQRILFSESGVLRIFTFTLNLRLDMLTVGISRIAKRCRLNAQVKRIAYHPLF